MTQCSLIKLSFSGKQFLLIYVTLKWLKRLLHQEQQIQLLTNEIRAIPPVTRIKIMTACSGSKNDKWPNVNSKRRVRRNPNQTSFRPFVPSFPLGLMHARCVPCVDISQFDLTSVYCFKEGKTHSSSLALWAHMDMHNNRLFSLSFVWSNHAKCLIAAYIFGWCSARMAELSERYARAYD